jgi:hypothetical protein
MLQMKFAKELQMLQVLQMTTTSTATDTRKRSIIEFIEDKYSVVQWIYLLETLARD